MNDKADTSKTWITCLFTKRGLETDMCSTLCQWYDTQPECHNSLFKFWKKASYLRKYNRIHCAMQYIFVNISYHLNINNYSSSGHGFAQEFYKVVKFLINLLDYLVLMHINTISVGFFLYKPVPGKVISENR